MIDTDCIARPGGPGVGAELIHPPRAL